MRSHEIKWQTRPGYVQPGVQQENLSGVSNSLNQNGHRVFVCRCACIRVSECGNVFVPLCVSETGRLYFILFGRSQIFFGALLGHSLVLAVLLYMDLALLIPILSESAPCGKNVYVYVYMCQSLDACILGCTRLCKLDPPPNLEISTPPNLEVFSSFETQIAVSPA